MNDRFLLETARAWRVHPDKVAELHDWVGRKVERDYQAIVFTKLLRRHMNTYRERPTVTASRKT